MFLLGRLMRKLLLLLLLLFMFVIPGCNHDTIEHVVLKEEYDENGLLP